MKEDQFSKEVMYYLDGISSSVSDDQALTKEAGELKHILSDLKGLPLEQVDPGMDQKIQKLIAKQAGRKQPRVRHLWPFMAAAASILIVFFIIRRDTDFEKGYHKFRTNPEKLSYIYKLNKEELNAKDIDWLEKELKKDISPNIKVTIIDLLDSYQSKLDKDFFNALQIESAPSVQMALLNVLESSKHVNFSEELTAVSQRADLDITVRQKANAILSQQDY